MTSDQQSRPADRTAAQGGPASLADEFRDRLVARIHELEASVAELEDLRGIAANLGIDLKADGGAAPDGAPTARERSRVAMSSRRARPARTRGATRATTPRSPATRPVDGSRRLTRRERVIEIVGDRPEVTVSELVEKMGVNRTSLYPVVRQLISDGLLEKHGKHLRLPSR